MSLDLAGLVVSLGDGGGEVSIGRHHDQGHIGLRLERFFLGQNAFTDQAVDLSQARSDRLPHRVSTYQNGPNSRFSGLRGNGV